MIFNILVLELCKSANTKAKKKKKKQPFEVVNVKKDKIYAFQWGVVENRKDNFKSDCKLRGG